MLAAALQGRFERVVLYGINKRPTSVLLDPHHRLSGWPPFLRRAIKAVRLVGHPRHWGYYLERWTLRNNAPQSLEERTLKLRRFLIRLKARHEHIIIVGRSAGAMAATLVADDVGIERIIALGYPFRHPELGYDSSRVRHLASLRTPCLIVQGTHDEYGGREVAQNHEFSPSVRLSFVDADHDFRLHDADLDAVIRLIEREIEDVYSAPSA